MVHFGAVVGGGHLMTATDHRTEMHHFCQAGTATLYSQAPVTCWRSWRRPVTSCDYQRRNVYGLTLEDFLAHPEVHRCQSWGLARSLPVTGKARPETGTARPTPTNAVTSAKKASWRTRIFGG
ncbi:hypothetical protein ACWZEH_35845 (plasmid) [Streptomyces sp. QTS137]